MKILLSIKTPFNLFLPFFLFFFHNFSNAQSSAEMNAVWQKNDYTPLESYFVNVVKQPNGNTYLASGYIIENGRQRGYIVEIDESGNKLNDWILTPPNQAEWTDGGNAAKALIRNAYFTSKGDLVAFGLIENSGADVSIKGHSIMGGSGYLKNGLWVCKISGSNKQVLINQLDRCNSLIADVVEHSVDQYLVAGYDYRTNASEQLLLRLYDSNGAWLYDNYATLGQKVDFTGLSSSLFKTKNGNYLLGAQNELREFDGKTFASIRTYASALNQGQGCVTATGGMTGSQPQAYWSLKSDGGVFVKSNMGSTAGSSFGSVFYEKNDLNQTLQCTEVQAPSVPTSVYYHPPYYRPFLLMPGAQTSFVGTKSDNGVNYMYFCKDLPGSDGYTLIDGPALPFNTQIATSAHVHGFVSCGQDASTKRAALSMLSACANFKATPVSDIYVPYKNLISLNQVINYQGAKASKKEDVAYTLELRVLKGVVNGQGEGDMLLGTAGMAATYIPGSGFASGKMLDIDQTFTLDPNHSYAEIEAKLTILESYLDAGELQQCNQIYIFKIIASRVSSTLFSDDVWFFGQNTGAREGIDTLANPFTSKGIIFKNEGGTIKPYDASGISKVNSWENSLSVSTPACNGSFIFYAQHTMLYNGMHTDMLNGNILGHTSTGDGLAAAYLGDNKYFFTSVSYADRGNLNYNIIDMNRDNGLGEKLWSGVVDSSGLVSEGIELIPVFGTYNQYWLIYFLRSPQSTIVVKKIDGTNPSAPIITHVSSISLSSILGTGGADLIWRMQANPDYTMLALNTAYSTNNCNHHFLNFNPLTGIVSFNRSLSTRPKLYSSYSSYVFHNNFLYIAESEAFSDSYYIYQYNLSDWRLNSAFKVSNTPASVGVQNWQGGGMKMGPDGKIYFIRQSSYYTGVINFPDQSLAAPGNVVENGLLHKYNGMGIAMSTGLTPPWINPLGSNAPPATLPDFVTTKRHHSKIIVHPLLNDSDDGGLAALNLVNVAFVDSTDQTKGTINWNSTTKEVVFIPNPKYTFVNGDKLLLRYTVKDVGIPVSLCADELIEITWDLTLVASNDLALVMENSKQNEIKILDNDILPIVCTPDITLIQSPKNGNAVIAGGIINYSPNTNFVGKDTLRYNIECAGNNSDAWVYISVHSKPDNMVDSSACTVPFPQINFKIKELWKNSGGDRYASSGTLVGDLDGDGIAEIIAFNAPSTGTYVVPVNAIAIYDGMTGALKATVDLKTYDGVNYPYGSDGSFPQMNAVLVDADRNGLGEIIIAHADKTLMSYEADLSSGTFNLKQKWAAFSSFTQPTANANDVFPQPNVTDFNGDGIPELLVYNKIYNAVTGAYLGETENIATAHMGRTPLTGFNRASNFQTTADFDDDGLPEIAAGGKIYKVNFNADKTAVTCSVLYSNINIADGYTAIADIDMDGKLDVIVTNTIPALSTAWLHVWSPQTNSLIKINVEPNLGQYKLISPPFVGDIDGYFDANTGKLHPEICLNISSTSSNTVRSYKYNSSTKTIEEKWRFPTQDYSGATPLTLFDFDNDGINELVYRDQSHLYILNGEKDVDVPILITPKIDCESGTAMEYATIVDVDGDGSANICVICSNLSVWSKPELKVFESALQPWAPTRKVWNQVNYEPLQINNDLTVPKFAIQKNTEFITKNGKSIYPFNGTLMQVPMVDKNFTLVQMAADPSVVGSDITLTKLNASHTRVAVKIKNMGSHYTNVNLPVSLFANSLDPNNLLLSQPVGVGIAPMTDHILNFDIPSYKLSPILMVRIQDDGIKYPADGSYLDCDYANNIATKAIVFAVDDYVSVLEQSGVNIVNIMLNDLIPLTCAPSIQLLNTHHSSKGTAAIVGNLLEYTPAGIGQDTLRYELTCGSETVEGYVFINVLDKSQELLDTSCLTNNIANFTLSKRSLGSGFTNYSPIVAADLDEDGLPDFVSLTNLTFNNYNPPNFWGWYSNVINIAFGNGQTKTITMSNNASAMGTIAIGKVKTEDGLKTLLFVAAHGALIAYDINGNMYWKKYRASGFSDQYYVSTYAHRAYMFHTMSLGLADLDGDGYSELYVGNKVFDAASGSLIATTTGPNQGFSHGHYDGTNWNYQSIVTVGDIDNDGRQELLIGNEAWKINIDRTVPYSPTGSLTKVSSVTAPIGSTGDGHTQVLDLDGDGNLDILVSSDVLDTKLSVYVWSPAKNAILASVFIPNGGVYAKGLPSVGDIDGDGKPEILMLGLNYLYAFKYDGTTTLNQFWTMPHRDLSHATGISLFDFDNDGVDEIVHRNSVDLCVIDGRTINPKVISSIPSASSTALEYPLILDSDGDGSAEIVVATGSIDIYKPTVGRWMPTRRLWNQFAYNGLLINDNLTTRSVPLNAVDRLAGKDNILHTADDVRPYNAFMRQIAKLGINGVAYNFAPNAQLVGKPTFDYDQTNDLLEVNLQIYNAGEVGFVDPFKITVYKNILGSNLKFTYEHHSIIQSKELANIKFYVPKFNADWVNSLPAFSDIVIRINDNGDTFTDQSVCDSSQRDYKSDLFIANDDRALVFRNSANNEIKVTVNDFKIPGCVPVINILEPAKYGASSLHPSDSVMVYVPKLDYLGADTIRYEIICGLEKDTAMIFISVIHKPDNISDADCYVDPPVSVWGINEAFSFSGTHSMSTPLVADLDGVLINGKRVPEIISPRTYAIDDAWRSNGFVIGNTTTMTQRTIYTAVFRTHGQSVAIADVDGDGEATIFLQGIDNRIYAYNGVSGALKPGYPSAILEAPYILSIADVNNDGRPEILAGQHIYDAITGTYILNVPFVSSSGAFGNPHMTSAQFDAFIYYYMPVLGDIDGDNTLEMVAASTVYKLNITNPAGTVGNSYTILNQANTGVPGMPINYDGATVLVDFDLDGDLDVCVIGHSSIGRADLQFYVWDGQTRDIIAYAPRINGSQASIPYVGDLDGDGYPNFSFSSSQGMTNYSYDKTKPGNIKLGPTFPLGGTPGDLAETSGFTLFDFNSDGKKEIVYRGTSWFYILDGTTLAPLSPKIQAWSGTVAEYLIVADVDGDGSAEIIVNQANERWNGLNMDGRVVVYKSNQSGGWAPARPVWNQWPYNAVLINDDMTVPKYSLSPATVFPGKDGLIGTTDDVRPYNSFLMQQTVLDKKGNPIWLTPNAQMGLPDPTFQFSDSGDSMQIKLVVNNVGDAALDPIKITVYKDVVGASPKYTYTYPLVIPAGGTAAIKFSIPNFRTWIGTVNRTTQLIVKINDNGNGFSNQMVCDSTHVSTIRPFSTLVMAHNDYNSSNNSLPINIKVLANDSIGSCKGGVLSRFDTIPKSGLNNGTLQVNIDSSFTYHPKSNFIGVDSVSYYIKCGVDSSAAKVHFITHKPMALVNEACPDAVVTLGFDPIPQVNYWWYKTDGSLVAANTNTLIVTKNSADDIGVWWVEPIYKGIKFPRIKIELNLAASCAVIIPIGCAKDGTIIFKEDFGGNHLTDPEVRLMGIPQVGALYKYTNLSTIEEGEYSILKKSAVNNSWYIISDHTYPNEFDRGYMLQMNAGQEKEQLYEHTLKDLCAGSQLYFSAWVANVVKYTVVHKVNLIFSLEDAQGNVVAKYTTGNFPDEDPSWKQYGFDFIVPQGLSELTLRIVNNGTGSNGNDFAIDDIEIRLCTDPIFATADDVEICPGENVTLTGAYTDNKNLFGNPLSYQWLYSTTGNINNPADWSILVSGTGNTPLIDIYTQSKPVDGYYRFVVSSAGNIDKPNCRAASDPVKIDVHNVPEVFPDIRVQVNPLPHRDLYLSKFLDTLGVKSINWTKISEAAPNFVGLTATTVGQLHTADFSIPGVYTYNYQIGNNCFTGKANMYVKITNKLDVSNFTDTIVVCTATAGELNLMQILGLSLGVEWVFPSSLKADLGNSLRSVWGPFYQYNSVYILNVQKAYSKLDAIVGNPYGINYRGDNQAKAIRFEYKRKDHTGALQPKVYQTILVLTDQILK